jgi:hypothetical protein
MTREKGPGDKKEENSGEELKKTRGELKQK